MTLTDLAEQAENHRSGWVLYRSKWWRRPMTKDEQMRFLEEAVESAAKVFRETLKRGLDERG